MMQVPIINDVLLENKEEIFFIRLMITSFAPGLLVGASTVTVTIIDDDCKCACRCMLEIFDWFDTGNNIGGPVPLRAVINVQRRLCYY